MASKRNAESAQSEDDPKKPKVAQPPAPPTLPGGNQPKVAEDSDSPDEGSKSQAGSDADKGEGDAAQRTSAFCSSLNVALLTLRSAEEDLDAWFYLDNSMNPQVGKSIFATFCHCVLNALQGPFSWEQMKGWWNAGLFQVPLCCSVASARPKLTYICGCRLICVL
jgi:hypothetical protein